MFYKYLSCKVYIGAKFDDFDPMRVSFAKTQGV